MKNLTCWGCALMFASLPILTHAQTTEPAATMTRQQMQQRMEDLQSQVNDLRDRMNAVTPVTQPATQSAGSSFAQHPATPVSEKPQPQGLGLNAGYDLDKGFYIRSQDGNFLLHPWAFIQPRDAYVYRSVATNNLHDGENGFELPRAKFILDGNIFSKDLTFQMIWATSDTSGNLGLQDAWGRYHIPHTLFAIEGGNIRDPVDHEQLMFATKSLTPDRSIVNNVLLNGDDIVKGAELSVGYDDPVPLRGELAVTSGERNFDTTFQTYPDNPASWGLAARVEYKAFGSWGDYNQFTALHDQQPLLVFGAGADYTEGGATAGLTHVVDAQFNTPDHLTFYTAYLGRYVRHDGALPTTNGNPATTTAATADTYDATVRVMAAYLIEGNIEPFARYEYLRLDAREFTSPTNHDISDITAGMNYYFYGHKAKLTFGASYLPQGSPVPSSIGDLLPTHRGHELILQTQMQFIF